MNMVKTGVVWLKESILTIEGARVIGFAGGVHVETLSGREISADTLSEPCGVCVTSPGDARSPRAVWILGSQIRAVEFRSLPLEIANKNVQDLRR